MFSNERLIGLNDWCWDQGSTVGIADIAVLPDGHRAFVGPE
jgi:hypothetical protein